MIKQQRCGQPHSLALFPIATSIHLSVNRIQALLETWTWQAIPEAHRIPLCISPLRLSTYCGTWVHNACRTSYRYIAERSWTNFVMELSDVISCSHGLERGLQQIIYPSGLIIAHFVLHQRDIVFPRQIYPDSLFSPFLVDFYIFHISSATLIIL